MNVRSSPLSLNVAWEKYLRFEKLSREKDGDISTFISEWEKKMTEALSAGCQYSDLVLALKLIEKANLGVDSTQYIISKVGLEGSNHFLPAIIAEIRNFNKLSRPKEDPSWPVVEQKLDQDLSSIKEQLDDDDLSPFDDDDDFGDFDDDVMFKADEPPDEQMDTAARSSTKISPEKSDETPEKKMVLGNYGCNQCSQVFRSKFKWEQHLKIHANRYQCSKCEKGFLTRNVLVIHMRRCQPGVTLDLDSDVCMVKDEEAEASESKDDVKNEKTVAPCEICGQLLKESSMKNHLGTHNRKFKCTICNKFMATKARLKTHTLSHSTQRDFICTFCGKTYKTKFALNIHTNTHTKAKSYVCSWCGKKFYNWVSWKVHVRSQHTGEGAHQCTVCQKKFFIASKLRYHMRTHTGEKPHKCEYCGKSFGDRSTYKKHIKRIHSKVNDLTVNPMKDVSFPYE